MIQSKKISQKKAGQDGLLFKVSLQGGLGSFKGVWGLFWADIRLFSS